MESLEGNVFPSLKIIMWDALAWEILYKNTIWKLQTPPTCKKLFFRDFDPDLHNIISLFSQHEEISPLTETYHVDIHVSYSLQYDFKEKFQCNILKYDSKLVINKESISIVVTNFTNDLTYKEIELVSSKENLLQWEETGKDIKISKSENTKNIISVVNSKYQKNNQYFVVSKKYLAGKINSISEFENWYDLNPNLFDVVHI